MDAKFKELFIFELANNHQGDIAHGLAIIAKLGEVARRHGINAAVKLQYRDLDTIIHPDFAGRTDVKHIPRFLSTRLSSDQFYTLVTAIREAGLLTMCTPFDERSVDLCMDHGIDILKIASCSATDWPLLEAVAQTGRPVILSAGGKTFSDMDKIYNFLTHRKVDFAMLHCVGLYPVQEEQVQLHCIPRMRNRYPEVTIGYSGHEDPSNYTIVQMAVAMGAEIVERHVGLGTESIKLNAYSTDVREVDGWVEAVLAARRICGDGGQKRIPSEELQSMNELARGCWAARPIQAGQELQRGDVFFAMPCAEGQTTSGQFLPGMVANRDYAINEPIYEKRAVSVTSDLRSVIHDVKGMLYEAKIVVGSDFELELSHHFGMQHFRHYGATIINIINREYCKKLIIILPGQQHPTHYHKVKEESFQVLYGKLTLTLDGVTRDVRAGEVVTVERGAPHAFTSAEGCVFEEVSTTHVKNDSIYEDPKIAALDLIQRKTTLKEW